MICDDCVFRSKRCVYHEFLENNDEVNKCIKFVRLYADDTETDVSERLGYGLE